MQRQNGQVLVMVALVLAGTLAAAGCRPEGPEPLTVVGWGGSYGRAVEEGAVLPFTLATGIPVRVEDYNGGLAEIRAQVDVGNIHWDVVGFEIADAVRACDEGLLEPIDIDQLPAGPDGTPAAEDFALRAGPGAGPASCTPPPCTPTTSGPSGPKGPRRWPISSTWTAFRGGEGCGASRRGTWSSR